MSRSSVIYRLSFVLLAVVCFCLLITGVEKAFAQSSAAEATFNSLLTSFKNEGIIPHTNGTKKYIGDKTIEWAQMGLYHWQEIGRGNHFILSANVSWESASRTPNNFEAGCGVLFHGGNGPSNHVLASIRMDGLVYFSGFRNGAKLDYGTYKYDKPSLFGSRDLVLIVHDDQVMIYLNGQRFVRKANIAMMGDTIALATLSGTNAGFGTRCTWKDVYLYTW